MTISQANSRPQGTTRAVLLLTALDAVVLLDAWCVVDYALIQSPRYPGNVHDFNWFLPAIPVMVVVFNYLVTSVFRAHVRTRVCIMAAFLALPLAILLILFLGTSFHLSAGGSL